MIKRFFRSTERYDKASGSEISYWWITEITFYYPKPEGK